MKTRLFLTTLFVIISLLLIVYVLSTDDKVTFNDFLLNLGTEIIGIALTVSIVDWIFERKKKVEEVKRICWSALHQIDHAIWVWKGGIKAFNTNELIFLINDINNADKLPSFTQNLLLHIASRAENEILTNKSILQSNKRLKKSLQTLVELSQLRDDNVLMSNENIKTIINNSIQEFLLILKIEIEEFNNSGSKKFYNSSVKMQEWRHFGIEKNED
jgi:hypothetical protein